MTVCWVVDTGELPVEEPHRLVADWVVCRRSAWEADIEEPPQSACRPAWWGLAGCRPGPDTAGELSQRIDRELTEKVVFN